MGFFDKVRDTFIIIEDDEDDQVPAEAADEDLDIAVPAARQRVEAGPAVGRAPNNQRVSDYVEDSFAELDEAAFSRATPDLASETAAFDEIYAAVGLPGATDTAFTIYKVEKILQSEHLDGLGDKAKAASVLVTLEASGVGLTAVIQDAVARDNALDQYDEMLRRDIKDLEMDIEITNATIEADIAEYLELKRQEIAGNNAKLGQAQQLYTTWNTKKQIEEDRLFNAVAPFVAQNPITRDD